jgi:hypothetical protein
MACVTVSLRDDAEHLHLDAVELVEEGPGAGLGEAVEEAARDLEV